MIGRGTRLCPGLTCVDQIDGEYTGKRRFLIFDYCGNFEYFRQHVDGYESKETKTLSEKIFSKRICLAVHLQEASYAASCFQEWRKELVEACQSQVAELNASQIAVRQRMQFVDKYKDISSFSHISEGDQGELLQQLAPLVDLNDPDECAKRFDNFMYGLMLASIERLPPFPTRKNSCPASPCFCYVRAASPKSRSSCPSSKRLACPTRRLKPICYTLKTYGKGCGS